MQYDTIRIKTPPLQEWKNEVFDTHQLSVYILRLDLIHPEINGNKYFKLKYNLNEFFNSEKEAILTFGGAYSNHIRATAFAGKLYGIRTIGLIRGEELRTDSNEILQSASASGMELKFISRSEYRKIDNSGFLTQLESEFGKILILPEGGSNENAILGAEEIYNFIPDNINWICVSCGTGGTLAGIGRRIKAHQKILGVNVLNADNYIAKQWMKFNSGEILPGNVSIFDEFHFGGYAKDSRELTNFCDGFEYENNFRPDEIYNAKLFFAVQTLAVRKKFEPKSKILCINTGGFPKERKII